MAKSKKGVKKALKNPKKKTYKLGGKRKRVGYVDYQKLGTQLHNKILGVSSVDMKATSSPAPQEEMFITVTITKHSAKRISHALDDLLCWATGFQSAFRMDNSNELLEPFNNGVRGVRDIHDLIKYKL